MYQDKFNEVYLNIINQGKALDAGVAVGKAVKGIKKGIKKIGDKVSSGVKDFAEGFKNSSPEELFKKGHEYFNNQGDDKDKAISFFIKVVESKDGEYMDKAAYYLGQIYRDKKEWDKAIKYFKIAAQHGIEDAAVEAKRVLKKQEEELEEDHEIKEKWRRKERIQKWSKNKQEDKKKRIQTWPVHCPKCGQSLGEVEYDDIHLSVYNPKKLPYCDKCDYQYTEKDFKKQVEN